jgi:hypothetical protein
MHDNTGIAQLRDDRVRKIARAFRRAARQHDHVAFGERAAHSGIELVFVVGISAEGDRLAARFGDSGGDDRAIRVINRTGPERRAGLRQLVAGREHGDFRLAHDLDRGNAAGGQHADFARADQRAAAQERLAARHIGAGEGYELPRRDGAMQVDGRSFFGFDQIGPFDHDDGIGAARDHAAGGNRRCRSGGDGELGGTPQASTSPFSRSRRGLASLAPRVSAALTAKPSTFERSKGGVSMGAQCRLRARDRAKRRAKRSPCRAASDRDGARNGCALPRARQLRETAPGARRRARLRAGARRHDKFLRAVAAHGNNLISVPWRRQQGLRSPAGPESSRRRGRAPAS